jgi:4-amino-4-deoxy-L-arabinose transferase-like glycosyltransferase
MSRFQRFVSILKTSSPCGSRRALSRAAALLALAFFVFNSANMVRRGPYATHPDEGFIVKHAWDIVKSGDLNPHFFNYGSLPIYLTSASLGAAAHVAKLRGEIANLEEAEPISFPYYGHPGISYAPRFVFALLAALALLGVGLIARALRPSYPSVLVSIVVLGLYPQFQRSAWSYLNADIVVTGLATCALAYLAETCDSERLRQRVLIPALFCGTALATKYNAGLLLLPFAAAIALKYPARRALLMLVSLGAATAAIFVICEPFAVLDFEEFRAALLYEMDHYGGGHTNHDGTPGWPMLQFHVQRIRRWLGYVASALIVLGVGAGLVRDRKRTLLLLSFPLATIAFMSMQRVNFPRNLLPSVACLTPFCGLGLRPIQQLSLRVVAALGRHFPRVSLGRDAQRCAALALTAALLLSVLFVSKKARTGGDLALVDRDSRREVSDWLIANTPRGRCHLLLPELAALRPADLADHCTVEEFEVVATKSPAVLARELLARAGERDVYLGLLRWRDEAVPMNDLPALLELGPPLFESGYLRMSFANARHSGDPLIRVYVLSRGNAREQEQRRAP